MKIKSTIKLDSVKETVLPLLEKKFIIEHLIAIIIFVILLLPIPKKNNPIIPIACIIAIIIQIISFIMLLKAKKKIGIKLFLRTYPKEEYILTVKFNKNDMIFENEYFTKEIKVKYKDISKIKQTKNYHIIYLINKEYFLINKKDISISELQKIIGKVK